MIENLYLVSPFDITSSFNNRSSFYGFNAFMGPSLCNSQKGIFFSFSIFEED